MRNLDVMQEPTVFEDSALDEPIIHQPRITRWTLLYALLILLVLGTRLWGLDSRAYCHDESIHAWESWKLANGLGYVHDPPYHGPFLYHATALVFALFGDSDVTGRLAAVVGGILITLAPWFLRRWLGRWGVLAATLFMALSPVLMHRSRFIRHDQFAVVANLILFVAILNYLEKRQTRDLYLVAAAVAWGFTTKETTFITYALFGIFLAGYALWQLLRGGGEAGVSLSQRLRALAASPVFDLLVVIGTLVLPLASPLLVKLMGRDPMDTSGQGIIASALVWGGVAIVAASIGLWWDIRRWPICAALFYLIFVPLYTTMFSNMQGFATGTMGQLGYWLSQQGVRRGSQPWFYYLLLLGMYEFAALAAGLGAIIYALMRRPAPVAQVAKLASLPVAAISESRRSAPTQDRGMETAPTGAADVGNAPRVAAPVESRPPAPLEARGMETAPTGAADVEIAATQPAETAPAPFVPFMIWWFLGALLLYTWAGEKMPWLTMHLVVPLQLLAGWGLGRLLSARWPSPPAPLPHARWERGEEGLAPGPTQQAADEGARPVTPASDAEAGDEAVRGTEKDAGPANPALGAPSSPPLPRGWWERGRGGEGGLDYAVLLVPILVLFALLNRGAVGEGSALNQATARWAGWMVAAVIALWIAWLAVRRGRRVALRLAALSAVATLLLLTVRVAWMATYQHADLASEFLVYAQGSPDVRRVARDLDALSYRLTGGLDIKLAYDEDAAWPFIWYLRNYTNAQYFRNRPALPIDADVIIVGETNEDALRPLLEGNYVGHQYRLIWWPNEDWYKAWTEPGSGLWQQLSTAEGRSAIWDVLWERKYDFSLQDWPSHLQHTFTVYVRKDLALPLGMPLLAAPAQPGGS